MPRFDLFSLRIHPLPALLAIACAVTSASGADYNSVGSKLATVVEEEMRAWNIGGISVALVDDQAVVYARGFGEAGRDSVFRVGSISKLFNAIAVMQQVEAGKLDLDAPLPPDLRPVSPFPDAPPVTLRQLLCHRSGLTREATVGGYLDDSEPSLAATVATVPSSVLVTRPGQKTRYSNIGPSLAGFLVERASGQPFEAYQRSRVFGPLGMTNSAWTLKRVAPGRLIVSHLRVADGEGGWRRQKTPVFDLGTIPAGNLFSTAEDLARFASAMIAGGGGLIRRETLEEMWQPQLTDEATGFGLGFRVGKYREHRTVSHNGAVYGHSTSLVVLPNEKLAVIVLGNEDVVNGRIRRISHHALSLLLEAKLGEPPPPEPANFPVRDPAMFAGDYESQSYWAHLEVRDGQLAGDISGQPTQFRAVEEMKFLADSRIEDATPVVFRRNAAGGVAGFLMDSQQFERVPAAPAPLPREWRSLLGSYGLKFIPLVVSERHGHLYVMTENMVDYRLTPVNRSVFTLPPGMYADEQVVFLRGRNGRIHALNFANMLLSRR